MAAASVTEQGSEIRGQRSAISDQGARLTWTTPPGAGAGSTMVLRVSVWTAIPLVETASISYSSATAGAAFPDQE
jgi:hypothetical protein